MISAADVNDVKKNWPKYRCRPSIMPFASFYGQDTAENFTFCLMNMFGSEMGTALGPVFVILGSIVTTLVTLVQTANSLRIQFATMMGGVNTIFSNFADRFKQLMSAVNMSAYRMKLIMGRLYGAFFAMIYMSIAGMTAVDNFTNTILFDFLDTFCFDPTTLVEIEGKGSIQVKDVVIGDVFAKTGSVVSATFEFEADGQQMVELPGNIIVSTNHYIYYLGKWIQAGSHPEAKTKGPWAGGKEKPLICFNTSDHKIPIGYYVFLDYDETKEGDKETMEWIDHRLNGKQDSKIRSYDYNTCVESKMLIRMKDGSTKEIEDIQLGEVISTGTVIGIIKKQTNEVCKLLQNEVVTPGLCYWQTNTNTWIRAGDVFPIQQLRYPQTFYSLVVLKSASFETSTGTFIRDYVEIHSPEAEAVYARKIESAASHVIAGWAY